ncbi:MAG: ActS/PrrB/RegB family redox-sensitive histidine kinase [Hyphomicrobiaceae bacterium]|nr:ActS/PrrB/RegB family redox-sensitive histidine kinase [Hyphomicrobiaceae bacterium]
MVATQKQPRETRVSGLRLQTAVRLRWFGVIGQLVTLCLVYFVLGFDLPIGICLGLVAASAWLNVFVRLSYTMRSRLSTSLAMSLLAWDILQLSALLYLTGGVENPFVFLIVVPVTVSASTLPPLTTVGLGLLAVTCTVGLTFSHQPLPWTSAGEFELPLLYSVGTLASLVSGMIFLALYAWRLASESRQMSDALAATEMVLAREQQLHALDGLAAAAAHELGTPLSTITVVAKELSREVPANSPMAEDLALLQSQAVRCREILKKLTRTPAEPDPLHAHLTVSQLIEEAAAPYRGFNTQIVVTAQPANGKTDGAETEEPVGERRPGLIYGIGNLLENAVDFAHSRVDVTATWSAREIVITISDDGPGIPPDVMEALGDPFITTRPSRQSEQTSGKLGKPTGLGLGFFIAKTLLERSGATVSLDNRPPPAQGAVVQLTWTRESFAGQPPAQGWSGMHAKPVPARRGAPEPLEDLVEQK